MTLPAKRRHTHEYKVRLTEAEAAAVDALAGIIGVPLPFICACSSRISLSSRPTISRFSTPLPGNWKSPRGQIKAEGMPNNKKKIRHVELDPVSEGLLKARAAINGTTPEQELQRLVDDVLLEIAETPIKGRERDE